MKVLDSANTFKLKAGAMPQKVTCAKRVRKVVGAAVAPAPDQRRCVVLAIVDAIMPVTTSVFVPAIR